MKIAIIGFGREGQSVYKYLKNKHGDIIILDKKFNENYLNNLDQYDLIFRSPGVPYHLVSSHPNVSSATKLFFEKCPCTIIGVTGTKGKGTTCTLIYNILKACGKDVYLVGNIGKPALDVLPKLKNNSLVVFELSSFQLQDLKQSPQIAVMLDIFPDHLDHHKTYEEYIEAKKNIYRHQKPGDKAFFIKDIKNLTRSNLVNLKIPGEHNLKNATMAYLVTKHLGCPEDKIKEVIFSFKGNEHRLEFVRELAGVKYYNDSASTNPQTTLAAIKSFKAPKILIVGGIGKGLDYSIWDQEFPKHQVKAVIKIGKERSLQAAVQEAEKLAQAGDIILLSPGAASFDMFKNYEDRGQKFKKLVKSL